MSDDLLSEATRALREETASGDEAAPFTRARVMASLHRTKRRRRFHFAALVPIAAVLAGSTALASWGSKVGWKNALEAVGLEPAAAPSERAVPRVVVRASSRSASVLAHSASHEPKLLPAAPPVEAPPSEPPLPPAPPVKREKAVSLDAAAMPDPELALYRSAHHAHFAARDPRSALALWDSYLAKAPRGRFAVEASYNRALCLVRLGRAGEARRTLQRFADGAFGDYRREDARALLDALEH